MKKHASAFDPIALGGRIIDSEPLLPERIAKAVGVKKSEARSLLVEVIKFLILCYENRGSGQKLTPAIMIDQAWHELILFTRLYADFCQTNFGMFIHHHPGGTGEENRQQFRRTLLMYGLHFDRPPRRFWGDHGYLGEPVACGL